MPEKSAVSNPYRAYLISSVAPSSQKSGGEIVLHRHFVQRTDFDFHHLDVPLEINSLFRFLERTRFRTYVKAFSPFYVSLNTAHLRKHQRPDLVVTVAHGRHCYLALQAARYWNVPLVTFFHDWAPATGDVHPLFRSVLTSAFRRLYRRSAASLCVSEQMLNRFGSRKPGMILYPIPSTSRLSPPGVKATPVILYQGFCGGGYRQMLNELIRSSASHNIALRLGGAESETLDSGVANVMLSPLVDESQLEASFVEADILLVVLGFDSSLELHYSTHFPSKIPEYCGKGRMIAIWGPQYSTSAAWARRTGAAFSYEGTSASEFIKLLLIEYFDDRKRQAYISKAQAVYQQDFDPALIHEKLVSVAHDAITSYAEGDRSSR